MTPLLGAACIAMGIWIGIVFMTIREIEIQRKDRNSRRKR